MCHVLNKPAQKERIQINLVALASIFREVLLTLLALLHIFQLGGYKSLEELIVLFTHDHSCFVSSVSPFTVLFSCTGSKKLLKYVTKT